MWGSGDWRLWRGGTWSRVVFANDTRGSAFTKPTPIIQRETPPLQHLSLQHREKAPLKRPQKPVMSDNIFWFLLCHFYSYLSKVKIMLMPEKPLFGRILKIYIIYWLQVTCGITMGSLQLHFQQLIKTDYSNMDTNTVWKTHLSVTNKNQWTLWWHTWPLFMETQILNRDYIPLVWSFMWTWH